MSLPVHRRELAMYVFLVSLAVFFFFTLVAVFVIRGVRFPSFAETSLRIPMNFLLSTVFLIFGSHTLFRALYHVRHQQLMLFRYWLSISLICAVGFTGLQSLGMKEVLLHFDPTKVHVQDSGSYKPIHIDMVQNETIDPQKLSMTRYQTQFNLVAGLVGLHVVHFVGGVIFLAYICTQAFQGRYDHEYYSEVKLTAYYWRFLDAVWLMMLCTFCFAS